MEDNGASSYHRFLKGDDESLREIIISYQPGLILYIYSILDDYQTAEEVAEDTAQAEGNLAAIRRDQGKNAGESAGDGNSE